LVPDGDERAEPRVTLTVSDSSPESDGTKFEVRIQSHVLRGQTPSVRANVMRILVVSYREVVRPQNTVRRLP